MSNPDRPTERIAFYEILTTRPTWTMGNPGMTVYASHGKQSSVVIERTPLWFDVDDDVEIEDPDDESPDYEDYR